MKASTPEGNAIVTHAQSGSSVSTRKKPKQRPAKSKLLPTKAAKKTGSFHMDLPSSLGGFISALRGRPGASELATDVARLRLLL